MPGCSANWTKKPVNICLNEKGIKSSLIFLVTDHIAKKDLIYTLTEESLKKIKNYFRRS